MESNQIIEDYKNGLSASSIAKNHNCGISCVYYLLHKNKIKIRPAGFQKEHEFYPGGILFKKGQKPWNTGLTKETDERVKLLIEKMNHTKIINNSYVKGNKHYNWKGGRYCDGRYNYILNPNHLRAKKDGYVAEHMLVIEKKIGRPLKEGEVIHHIDGNKTNNNPDNLLLFPNSKSHLKFHSLKRKNPNLTFEEFIKQWKNK